MGVAQQKWNNHKLRNDKGLKTFYEKFRKYYGDLEGVSEKCDK